MINKDKLIKELIMDEGYKTETYEDHLGFLTLGVGHLVLSTDVEFKMSVGTPVSEERILECLSDDIDNVCDELDRNMPWWQNLDDNRQRVLANMCFNLGYPRLSNFKNFLLALKAGKWEEAAEEMLDSKWATQVGDRAKRLAERMEKGGK
jgi:lysozyme